MGVRAKRGQWPDVDGDYQIVVTDGCHLFYVLGGSFGPDTEAVAERILAAINGDTVPAPTLPDDVGELVRLLRAAPHVVPKSRILAAADALEALGGQAAAPTLPDDLPSWVSMHATATGADLIEHDPNGDQWERSLNGVNWSTDHAADAVRGCTYLVRRRPVPVEPTTEKVPWWEAVGRTLPTNCVVDNVRRAKFCVPEIQAGGFWHVVGNPDGMVTVLREDGAS